jgi:hypothetical protein
MSRRPTRNDDSTPVWSGQDQGSRNLPIHSDGDVIAAIVHNGRIGGRTHQ